MKKLVLSILSIVSISLALAQTKSADSIDIKYNLAPAKGYEKDVMPKVKAFIKVNGKKYDLKTPVMSNKEPGDIEPDISYNKKAKRNEYLLNTWFAGGGTNFKAYISGSKASNTRTLIVFAQDLDEQAANSKWRLLKAIKL